MDAHTIWNRAVYGGGRKPGQGDAHLAALLSFHGFAMNGGVFHACSILTGEQIGQAVNGFRYLQLGPIADVVAEAGAVATSGVLDMDFDEAERLTLDFDDRYYSLIPSDQVIDDRFQQCLQERPADFAPVTEADLNEEWAR